VLHHSKETTQPKVNKINIIDNLQQVTQDVQMGKLPRRKIRNVLFRYRSGRLETEEHKNLAQALRMIYEPQFSTIADAKMDWSNFTFLWDIHPTYYLMIVPMGQWLNMGGTVNKKTHLCEPTAFTKQKV